MRKQFSRFNYILLLFFIFLFFFIQPVFPVSKFDFVYDNSFAATDTKNIDLSDKTIHLIGHAHIDLSYRWRWNETLERVLPMTFKGVLDLMSKEKGLTYAQSSVVAYEAVEKHYPDMFREIEKHINDSTWRVVGGMWCEPDLNLPCGESLIRQFLIGKKYMKNKFNIDTDVGWFPDCFGTPYTLPQILKGCGIKYCIIGRITPKRLFWWEGVDGSRILVLNPGAYSGRFDNRTLPLLDELFKETGIDDHLFLYGRGDHGGGPRMEDIEAKKEIEKIEGSPKFIFSTPSKFFNKIINKKYNLPTVKGEFIQSMRGVYTSQAKIKKFNRVSENMMLIAERFSAIATYLARKPTYPRVDFEEGWKKILFHQFHDDLSGTSVGPVYDDDTKDFKKIEEICETILYRALEEIGARIDTKVEGVPIVVYNPLVWKRTELVEVSVDFTDKMNSLVVKDYSDNPMPIQIVGVEKIGDKYRYNLCFLAEDIPSFGYKLFQLTSGKAMGIKKLRVSSTFMENEFFKITLDPETGDINSLYDKRADRDVLNGAGNVLQAIAEEPGRHTAWGVKFTDKIYPIHLIEKPEIIEKGPLRIGVRTKKRLNESIFIQDLILYRDVPRIDCRMTVDWQERETILKVAFPVNVQNAKAQYETPFGNIERVQGSGEVPALKWIDLANDNYGISLLNDCKYGFDVKDGIMRMSVLRSPMDLDPRNDQGLNELVYSIYPHQGNWKEANTIRRAYELNYPLIAITELKHSGFVTQWGRGEPLKPIGNEISFLKVEPENLIVTAIKCPDEQYSTGYIIIRFYEAFGKETVTKIVFPIEVSELIEMDMLENEIKRFNIDKENPTRSFNISVRPYEIKTIAFMFLDRKQFSIDY